MKPERYADIIIINGDIFCRDGKYIHRGGIAIKGDRIIFVGSTEEVNKFRNSQTKIIDAEGKTVLPGLIDSHIHLIAYGITLDYIDLSAIHSIEELKHVIAEEAKKRRRGAWIIGRGWDQEKFKEKRYPNRYDLDEVAPNNPIFLLRVCGHIAVANSMALKKANITRNTTDPPGGIIERDEKGDPTGILKENAIDLMKEALPKPTKAEYILAARRAIQKCLEYGITTVHMMSALPEEVDALVKLYKNGGLKLRIRIYLDHRYLDKLPSKLYSELKNDWIRLNGLKVMVDGSLGGRTAALREPYNDDPSNQGKLTLEPKQLEDIIGKAVKQEMQVAMHGIGDRAVETILTSLENINREMDTHSLRMRIEHGSIMPLDLIKKAKKLNVIISVQPSFIGADFWILDRVGQKRIKSVYNYKTLMRHGLWICAGSDAPVAPVDTFRDLYLAVTRGGKRNILAQYTPQEALTMEEAIMIYTYNGAFAGFDENKIGSIEPGKYADLVILDRKLKFSRDLKKVKTWMTIVNGKIVYRADQEKEIKT